MSLFVLLIKHNFVISSEIKMGKLLTCEVIKYTKKSKLVTPFFIPIINLCLSNIME